MAMGRRNKRVRQEQLWTPTAELPVSAGHPFYERLNRLLDEEKFDEFVEILCAPLFTQRRWDARDWLRESTFGY